MRKGEKCTTRWSRTVRKRRFPAPSTRVWLGRLCLKGISYLTQFSKKCGLSFLGCPPSIAPKLELCIAFCIMHKTRTCPRMRELCNKFAMQVYDNKAQPTTTNQRLQPIASPFCRSSIFGKTGSSNRYPSAPRAPRNRKKLSWFQLSKLGPSQFWGP
jgi:hypothetical protein